MQPDYPNAPPTADLVSKTKRGKPRQRSAFACEDCHRKRIRCSGGETGLPCDGCRRTSVSCRLVESKRAGRKTQRYDAQRTEPVSCLSEISETSLVEPDGVIPDSSTAQATPADLKDATALDGQGTDTLYASILDDSPSVEDCDPRGTIEQVVYLGETFNLTHLLRTTNPGARRLLHQHHRVLPADASPPSLPRHSDADDTIGILRRQDAFTLPSEPIIFALFKSYFTYFHPHYPILDRADFAERYRHPLDPPSYFLLQSVLFTAVGHCDQALIHQAGFASRYQARSTLFKRAKALYDADHETRKVILVQALFLISFWWKHPTDQKDTWHWLGNAISLAVTMGMHRSTKSSILDPRQQRMWKRIWWSLYAEDKHAAAALGRPVHIHLDDCDVEPLDEIDCREEPLPTAAHEGVFGVHEEVHGQYVIYLSELSKIVERIIHGSFNVLGQSTLSHMSTLESCVTLLDEWESRLPPELQDGQSGRGLWPSMLRVASRCVN